MKDTFANAAPNTWFTSTGKGCGAYPDHPECCVVVRISTTPNVDDQCFSNLPTTVDGQVVFATPGGSLAESCRSRVTQGGGGRHIDSPEEFAQFMGEK